MLATSRRWEATLKVESVTRRRLLERCGVVVGSVYQIVSLRKLQELGPGDSHLFGLLSTSLSS